MTTAGEIVQVDFCKSIIHSIAGLTYNEAQLMLDDPKIHDTKAESVKRLNDLAKIFRKRRMDAGALTLASPEVRNILCLSDHIWRHAPLTHARGPLWQMEVRHCCC